MEPIVFALFCALLIGCIAADISIVPALLAGLALFWAYGRYKKFSLRQLFAMSFDGVKTVSNILFTFVFIGCLTAMWRESGCIPSIVCYASGLIHPAVFILLTFLLNALVSVLTGTAFGTAATIGIICVSIGQSMHMPMFWMGGAVMSGAFVGDRCSPVSTSALLVSTVTRTDIYENIKNMIRTGLLPVLLTCAVYGAAGLSMQTGGASSEAPELFRGEFAIHPLCLLPAVVIFALALFKVKVRRLMLASILTALPIALFLQHKLPLELLRALWSGYEAENAELAVMINGGGIRSMLRVSAIVCIASCYSGIFKQTGLLNFVNRWVDRVARKFGCFAAVLTVSAATAAISCNQTLASMLTDQLTEHLVADRSKRANYLEDTVIVMSALVPWSIACSVTLTTVGAPLSCVPAAVYLYLQPLCSLLRAKRSGEDACSP